ncbi:related to NAD dependent epimerase/dehydratase family protein [Cephalotrichum gorgonifer]|uniref:Related to NAD dependent epimerase/dehydratase family protein n=1 Tax=Cephalotrichum gorgonifer TaxID=2041049 RepID=A0AAE8SUR1_9PEZI|nr:related to NAD dependent epimerase/dehydratase family protein [Cephalotrichum gorgonifer]
MSGTKILITGATGYIGGSVLSTLLRSSSPHIQGSKFSALVRKQEQADILKQHGVEGIVFSGLDDTEFVRKVASDHDVVIHTASSQHTAAAEAIILGLADRQKQTGKETDLIHTSGTSSIGDHPISKTYLESRILSDKDDIYEYQRQRESMQTYVQRTTDLAVFEKGEAAGVKTYILMSPTIYGLGSGLFNRTSIQIDAIIRAARRDGFSSVAGTGSGEWDHVHIEDLVELYDLVLSRLLAGDKLPANKQGIYFNETGNQSWREVSERVAKEGKKLGYLSTDEVREVSLDEAAKTFGSPRSAVEPGFASRARSSADRSREIGWKPKKTRKDFEESFAEEWKILAKEW